MSDYQEWDAAGAQRLRDLLAAPDATLLGYDFSYVNENDERPVTNDNREDFVRDKIHQVLIGSRLNALVVRRWPCQEGGAQAALDSAPVARHALHTMISVSHPPLLPFAPRPR
jgi:hypothetical protein